METVRSTVPGVGTAHHFTTRGGQRLAVLVQHGVRRLFVFGPEDPDTPAQTVVLGWEEADVLADVLRSRSAAERRTEPVPCSVVRARSARRGSRSG
ncbi:hypothetical protein LZG04_30400 [Saccharothrix sp. S26]|uniref:hypothetical protein n=1 Tax=Saccharothrix sp. S26 TaxID=2907215 RepID=UPI001F172C8F|nr:hypothetical protein [Saccharothrix sp. S26]MCE6999083.1 hypothetical protein [Saccharothrix sp. S26]